MSFQSKMDFYHYLPKIELHAHLNGSLSEITLKKLGCLDESISEYTNLNNILNKSERTLQECFELFKVAQNATNSVSSVYTATKSVIEEFADDHVIYLEIRTTPRAEENMTKEAYIESVVKAIKDNKRNIIVKLILSIDRRHKNSQENLDIILKMRKKHPDIIKGIDLSGNPYLGIFDAMIFQQARENGLYCAIHCAEIKNDKETEQILNFVPDRIGHGTFIHPCYDGTNENWQLYCEKKIPLECCITSNVVCGTSKSYKQHHIQEWIRNGLPFSINTDDKGVFSTTLTKEYEYVAANFNLSRNDLWNVSYESINYCFASADEKQLLKRKLEEWKEKHLHMLS